MTKTQTHDLVLSAPQEKLEWVTPKISLMEAGVAEGSDKFPAQNESERVSGTPTNFGFNGPS